MIRSILDGSEKSNFVLVSDSLRQSGIHLWLSCVNSLSQHCDEVHVLCLERKPNTYGLICQFSTRVILHDATSDLCRWFTDPSAISVLSIDEFLKDKCTPAPNKHIAIAVDSLSVLLLHNHVNVVCQQLHRLVSGQVKDTRLVACVHSDLHDPTVLSHLSHIASTVIHVAPTAHHSYHARCHVLHKRVTGKVLKTEEDLCVTGDYTTVECVPVSHQSGLSEPSDIEQVDPMADLTFNLSLSNKQRADKQSVVLPHIQDIQMRGVQVKGEIYYEPDDADDFDVEDPDNDLYI